MTSKDRSPDGRRPPTPTLGATKQYSKAAQRGGEESRAVAQVGLALCQAREPRIAGELAVAALTDPGGLGFERAIFFLLDDTGGWLEGITGALRAADGEVPRAAGAHAGEPLAERVPRLRIPTGMGSEHPVLQAMAGGGPVAWQAGSLAAESDAALEACLGSGRRWAVPVIGNCQPIGALVLGEPVPSGEKEAGLEERRRTGALLLAGYLGAAIGHLEIERQLCESVSRTRTLQEAVKVLLGAGNLPDVLELVARAGLRVTGGACALLWTYEEESRRCKLTLHQPVTKEHALEEWLPQLESLASKIVADGGTRNFPDLRGETELELGGLPVALPALFVPLDAFGDRVGLWGLIGKREAVAGAAKEFGREEEDLIRLLAGQAAVVIKNARLEERVRLARRQLQETQGALLYADRRSALGDLAVQNALEMGSALTAVSGFARRLDRDMEPDDANREYVKVILREAKRMAVMIEQQQQAADEQVPRLAMRDLNEIVRLGLQELQGELLGGSVRIEEAYCEGLPKLLLDAQRVRRMVTNILRSALDAMREGDALRIETLLQGERVLLEIAHTGEKMPGEAIEELLVPFHAAGVSGAGLGLAMAQQIVKEHGGEVSVRSEGEWSSIFTITFPVDANQERRKQPDRRRGRDRRRRGRD